MAGVSVAVGQLSLTPVGELAVRMTVSDNLALSGYVGILASGFGATISGNRSHGNEVGLLATSSSSGNAFQDNDARSNHSDDSEDDTSPIANTWTGNRAFSSSPSKICLIP